MADPAPVSAFGGATKRLLIIVGAIVVLAFLQWRYNIIPFAASQKASVPTQVDLSTGAAAEVAKSSAPLAALPSTATGKCLGAITRVNIWAWNAQMGFIYANGGPKTTAGSLMEKHGVCVQINRQDDTEKSKPDQIKFAQLLAKGDPNPSEGIQFVIIMGDGAAQYLAAVNKVLAKLGPDYHAEVVGAVGYSRGEDAFMGPAEWKDRPEAAKGALVAGVLRDGDWNIAQYWMAQNGILNNPDEKYYDANAVNWYAADDYIKAAEAYTSGTDPQHGVCEDRQTIANGKTTGQKTHICVTGVVTWTPGDVNVAKKKGGLVKILSTKENAYQMPAVLIGIHKWNETHAKVVQGILAASFDAADQVKGYDAALQRAGKASYAVYNEESPAYWIKYYKGSTERDKAGNPTPLGGSTVMNLGDNLLLFGLTSEGGDENASMFRATYEGFGNVAKQQYPALVPDFPKVAEAVNTSFLKALAPTQPNSKPDVKTFDSGEISDVVATRNWTITFDTGKATFTPAARTTLDTLYNELLVGGALAIEIDGHTDNTGNPAGNVALSTARADAVKTYLQTKSVTLFPDNRISVKGFGDAQPIASNATPDGKAQNRRVTIVLGNK
jgi:OOP family OmpA-OmpF porin